MKKHLRKNILLVEDDELFREAINNFLAEKYEVTFAGSAEEAQAILATTVPDLILLDITLPGMSGIDLLREIKSSRPDLPAIMLTAIGRIPKVVESIRLGAYDYLTKPLDAEELLLTIEKALESAEMWHELEQRRKLQLAKNVEYRIVGASAGIDKIRQEIQMVGKEDATILLEGETGTGKELVARALHAASPRASGPFVAINCGAIPKELMESELFGHQRGAFTGAQKDQLGKFQLAHRGTLLLDEISELTAEAQTKLLRAVEELEFYPVGGAEMARVDVRIIASTNRNLREMVERKQFRDDLFFRLNVYAMALPPLRERGNDILILAQHFIAHFNQKFGKSFQTISPEAQEFLLEYSWPGNVRELRNLIERIILSKEGAAITKEHLRILTSAAPAAPPETSFLLPDNGLDFEEVEKNLIAQALQKAKWNKTRAAKLLNLSSPTFSYRLEKYGLKERPS
ncbi:MAG: sigma-54-dependent transcriptional regulator [bacterium]